MSGRMHARVGHAYLKMLQLLADEPCRVAQEDGQQKLPTSRFSLPWPAAGRIRFILCENCGVWRLHAACAPAWCQKEQAGAFQRCAAGTLDASSRVKLQGTSYRAQVDAHTVLAAL